MTSRRRKGEIAPSKIANILEDCRKSAQISAATNISEHNASREPMDAAYFRLAAKSARAAADLLEAAAEHVDRVVARRRR